MINQSLIEIAGIKSLAAYYPNQQPPDTKIVSTIGVQGFVCYQDDLVILSFAGTNELKDLCPHLKALLKSWRNIYRTTEGAYIDAYESVSKQITNLVYPSLNEERKLLITGHSYGGALAGRASIAIAEAGYSSTTITYSEPSYLTRKEVANLSQNIRSKIDYCRIYNPLDPVGYLPLNLSHFPGTKTIEKLFFKDPHSMDNLLDAVKE